MRPLKTYEDWKFCIIELCQVPLTDEYVAQRLRELRDSCNDNTRKFVASWGEEHRQKVITWFEQAQVELGRPHQ